MKTFKQFLSEMVNYPLEHVDKWYGSSNYKQHGGKLVYMHPKSFLKKVRPLNIDDVSRDNIDDLKNHIQSGGKLDPLHIYSDGKEDGRHRAHAAHELGITRVPVIVYSKKA